MQEAHPSLLHVNIWERIPELVYLGHKTQGKHKIPASDGKLRHGPGRLFYL